MSAPMAAILSPTGGSVQRRGFRVQTIRVLAAVHGLGRSADTPASPRR